MLHPRARTLLVLSCPAILIGIATSLVLHLVLNVSWVMEKFLWIVLPQSMGTSGDAPFWMLSVLTLTGLAVGLIIRYMPGEGGPDPALEPLISPPITIAALPGLLLAMLLGLAGGVSLGPEHPIMSVNIALTVALGARVLPKVSAFDWTILAAAGTVGALFGAPVAAALIFAQTLNAGNEAPLWDRLFAPLLAAATGAVCTQLMSGPLFIIPLSPYPGLHFIDLISGSVVAIIAIALGMMAVWGFPKLHYLMRQVNNPILMLTAGGFVLGLLGVIGGDITLFSGLREVTALFAGKFTVSDYLLFVIVKLLALVVAAACGFRGGRIFPAIFVGIALGLMLHQHVPAVPLAVTLSCSVLGIMLVVTRDGWLSLFIAAAVVPDLRLLPLLCVVTLPAWLMLAGRPLMTADRRKRE